MIPDDVIEQVRDSTDLVALIGEAVDLRRTGADYRGACPFHGGTHRNFAVIPKKGRYYCFVCHESGDVFSWLMKRFGMDYPSAVREAARRAGIVIPERPGRAGPDPREPLFGAVAAAQDWFARQLQETPAAEAARDYLAGRDIPLETAAVLGLGFAPAGREFLEAMAALGIAPAVLAQAGLTVTREDGRDRGTTFPRFRSRLLFPIHDQRGRVVGFGGRLLGPGEPKYLNSPESDVFQKGKLLYNLHQAKAAIRKAEEAVLVEGYFDVLRLSLAGLDQVVAPLGTGLTPDQAALLRRFAPAAVLLYDSDSAGLRATFRTADELLRHGVRVRVATLPPGEDPDTLVRAGGLAALEPILRDSLDVMERKIQLLDRRGWFTGVEHRREALDRLLPTIRAASEPITRELYLSLVAERTGVSKEVLERELAASPAGGTGRPMGGATSRPATPAGPARYSGGTGRSASGGPGAPPSGRARSNPETQLLRVMLAAPELIERARADVAPALFEAAPSRELFEALLAAGSGDQLPPALSDEAQLLWSRLKEQVKEQWQEWKPEEVYNQAMQILCARPDYYRLGAMTDPGEKRQHRAALQARYPEADRWYTYSKDFLRRPKGA